MLHKRKTKKIVERAKHKCRLAAKVFQQVPGLHFKLKHAPMGPEASITTWRRQQRWSIARQATLMWSKGSYRQTVDGEIHIELPEEYQDFPGAVGRLNKSICGLVRPPDALTRSIQAPSRRTRMANRTLTDACSASS